VRVNPEIYTAIQHDGDSFFDEVERALSVHLVFKPDDNLHHEQFDVMKI